MKTLHQIREDLRAIRFYYEKKSDLERGAKHIGESAVVQLVENTMPPFVTLPSAYMICTYVFTSITTRKPSLRRTRNALRNISADCISSYASIYSRLWERRKAKVRNHHSIPKIINVAINIYRTKHYIVKQHLYFMLEEGEHAVFGSDDVYYPRTPQRDREYDKKYENSLLPKGQRIHTNGYTRYYVE